MRVLFAIKRFIECEGTVHIAGRRVRREALHFRLRVVGEGLGGDRGGDAAGGQEAEGLAALEVVDVARKDDVDAVGLEDGGELALALGRVVSHRDLKRRDVQGDEFPRLLGGLQVLVEPSHNRRVVRLSAAAVIEHDDVGRAVVKGVEAEGRVVLAGEGPELGRGFTLRDSRIPDAFRQAVLRGVEEVVGCVGVGEGGEFAHEGIVVTEDGIERN